MTGLSHKKFCHVYPNIAVAITHPFKNFRKSEVGQACFASLGDQYIGLAKNTYKHPIYKDLSCVLHEDRHELCLMYAGTPCLLHSWTHEIK